MVFELMVFRGRSCESKLGRFLEIDSGIDVFDFWEKLAMCDGMNLCFDKIADNHMPCAIKDFESPH